MTGIVVLGTSGHARSCINAMRGTDHEALGCIGGVPTRPLQAAYLGDDDALARIFDTLTRHAFVAIGANKVRQKVAAQVLAAGFDLPAIVAATADVAPSATVGAGAIVMPGAFVGPYSTIGAGAIINTGASVDHDCQIGDHAHLAPGVRLAGDVVVGEGAFLGIGAVAIPEISVGAWATAGAGSVLIRDVSGGQTVVGNPATSIRGKE